MKEFVVYTVLRIGLFVLTYLVVGGLWALAFGFDSGTFVWPFLISVLVSSLLSLRLLAGPRDAFAAKVDARASRAAQRWEGLKAREDTD